MIVMTREQFRRISRKAIMRLLAKGFSIQVKG